jgi:hypothetical protein
MLSILVQIKSLALFNSISIKRIKVVVYPHPYQKSLIQAKFGITRGIDIDLWA